MKTPLTVGKKLMLALGALVVVLLGLGYSSLTSSGSLSSLLDTSINKTGKKMELIGELQVAVERLRTAQRGVILYAVLKNPAVVVKSKSLFQSSSDQIAKLSAQIRPLLVTDDGRRAVDSIDSHLADWQPLYQDIVRRSDAGQFDSELSDVVNRTLVNYEPMLQASERLREILHTIHASAMTEAAATSSHSRTVAYSLIGLCMIVGAIVVWVVRRITDDVRQIANRVAEGAEQVASAATQVASSSQAMAQGASQQAASLEETSASTEELSSMTKRNAENSKEAADDMGEVSLRIEEADRNLELMLKSMNEITQSSDKISKIIRVIDEIAFQTNILALNAAVEAARAGEAGMGFAVVADEVRNLAQRSAQAAKDTATLIEESIGKSNDGKVKLDHVAKAIQMVTESATKVNALVEEVKLGSEEQAQGIDQMAKAIVQMQSVTQQTAAGAEQSAAASEELRAQSQTLQVAVNQLHSMAG